jgi:predicted dehydrogenase
MRFPSGILATCTTTYGANMPGYFRVYGSKGWLQVDQAFVYEGLRLRAEWPGTRSTSSTPPKIPPTSWPKPPTSPIDIQTNQDPAPTARKASAT